MLPSGSRTRPPRSPQDKFVISVTEMSPAERACWYTASASSTYRREARKGYPATPLWHQSLRRSNHQFGLGMSNRAVFVIHSGYLLCPKSVFHEIEELGRIS